MIETQMLFSYCIARFFFFFFDNTYLQKELIDFLLSNTHQRNDKSEINTFSWLWRALPSHTHHEISQKVSLDHIRLVNEMKNSLENETFIYFKHKIPTIITKMVFTNQFVGFFST